jgi:hypothetical protein
MLSCTSGMEFSESRAAEHVACLPKMAREKIFLGTQHSLLLQFLPTNLAIVWIYIYIYGGIDIVYHYTVKLFREWIIFYPNQSRWEVIICLNRLPKNALNILFPLSL